MTVTLVRFLVTPNPAYSAMRDVIPLWDVAPDFVWRWHFSEEVKNSPEIEWPGAGQAQCKSEADVPATEERLREIADNVNAQVAALTPERLKVFHETEADFGKYSGSAVAHQPDGAIQVIRWI